MSEPIGGEFNRTFEEQNLGKPLEERTEIRPGGFLRAQPGLHGTLAINSRVFFHHTTNAPDWADFPLRDV